ncbi:MAG: 50S ribosomal protein L4 [Chloroflexi bacterium RBG_19FT_COMBO_56_12]|nr:MAG: 50S ribosomal protein L4 [Chloroflexi bacterium RBG_16_58_14]OGO71005.1 MAG: 50S ribosomal protein L4 [Chloroflexi bacterium RBG_19FT_COMBO_56_12]
MEVDVLNMEGQKVRTVELPAAIFEAPINVDLMHQAYLRQMANARLGTHSTKTRGEVSGGGRKPWRQKGTGRARQGSTRAPQFRGGGKAHTPKPRSYAFNMPRKMRQAALRSALSVKASEQNIVVLDDLSLAEPKTRLMVKALSKLVGENTALILVPDKSAPYELVTRSTNNIPYAKILLASYLNIHDLLGFDKVVIPLQTLDVLSAHLG